jgi:ABC-type dipeptide/oligopeptide/nickel transport system ATPase subunit
MKKIVFIESESEADIELEISSNLVIVGANGSGKSRLGSILEHKNTNSKRISAQRHLQLDSNVQKQDFETAENRFKSSFRHQSVTTPQNDFQIALVTLFAQEARRNEDYYEKSQHSPDKVPGIKSKKDQVLEVWNFVFPNRLLKLEKDKIIGVGLDSEFSGSELSDGERVGLYLISQVLLAPVDYILIIDEPELHLHKSLMTRLWNKLESERKDCAFVYITHDLDFAVSKTTSKTIWIESYNNSRWKWTEVSSADYIPDNLLLEVLGSRKQILFVEGDKGSLDQQLYQSYYENFTIIPRGSCEKVIEAVKGFNDNKTLHNNTGYGLIDRDFRTDGDIELLKIKNIFTTPTKHIENIFLLPEIIEIVTEHIGQKEKKDQIIEVIISEYKAKLENINFSIKKVRLWSYISKEIGELKNENEMSILATELPTKIDEYFKTITPLMETDDVLEILKTYPHKGLVSRAMSKVGVNDKFYQNLVFNFLTSQKSEELRAILKNYLPDLPIS